MTQESNALRLADLLDTDGWPDAAAELHRLHEANQELWKALKDVVEDADDCGCKQGDKWCPLRHAEQIVAKHGGAA